MDFAIPRHVQAIARRVRQFVDEEVIPVESELLRSGEALCIDRLQGLRSRAKAAGLWAPTMPKEWGGMGLDIQEIAPVFEAAGHSLLGPLAIHCASPDEGNMHLLRQWGAGAYRNLYRQGAGCGNCQPRLGSLHSNLRRARDLPLSTWFEKARAFRIYDGASEAHRMVVARDVIKKYGASK